LDQNTSIVRDPVLVALYRYWQSKRADGRLPSRAEIDPGEIKNLLPWIFIMGVGYEPRRFNYRLIGTAIVDFLRRDFTGKEINEELYGANAQKMTEIFNSAVDRRDATAVRCPVFYAPGREFFEVCWTMLPLSANGGVIDQLLCGYRPLGNLQPFQSEGLKTMQFDNIKIIRSPVFETT
jgi:hypothetical protein